MAELLILKRAQVYRPEPAGVVDIVIGGGIVLSIAPEVRLSGQGVSARELDCTGLTAIPGLIDGHVHIAGAGGEGGPPTRTPEVALSQLLEGGITTVIGCLGTDGYTRTPVSVLMKVKSLRAQGVSSWMLTGAYQVPPPTITGDPGRDVAMIEEVIGIGEVAISDHRASWMSPEGLVDLASKARVGGMIGGKAGIVQLHMGDARDPLRPIYRALEISTIPIQQFMPTHMNRNAWIFEDAKEYGRRGGRIDITTSSYRYFPDDETKPSRALAVLLDAGVPLDRITFSSDGNGSLPLFDASGDLVRLEIGQPRTIYTEMVDAIVRDSVPVTAAVSVVTRNPARAYGLRTKGELTPGGDADVVLVDHAWGIRHVIAGGRFLMEDGIARRGTFEGAAA
ncbi:MAG: beta-aspartyl-peptidase [Candidatus Eisenbacteria bacterium]|nr:beta-aspartyl-peptidase [Candidatus Eisenbacteria bacterium]